MTETWLLNHKMHHSNNNNNNKKTVRTWRSNWKRKRLKKKNPPWSKLRVRWLTINKKPLTAILSLHFVDPTVCKRSNWALSSVEAFTPQQIVASNTFPRFHWTRSNCLLQRASLLRTPTTVSHNCRPNCCRWHSGKDIPSTKRRQIFLLTLHNFALVSTVRCEGLWLSAEWCIRTTHYWLTLIINDSRHLRYSLLLTSLSQSTPELCVGRSGWCASIASWQRQHKSVRTECKKWSEWLKLSHLMTVRDFF